MTDIQPTAEAAAREAVRGLIFRNQALREALQEARIEALSHDTMPEMENIIVICDNALNVDDDRTAQMLINALRTAAPDSGDGA